MKETQLRQLALYYVKKLVEHASSALVSESCSKEKGNVTHQGNPLFEASSCLSDARQWLDALLENREE